MKFSIIINITLSMYLLIALTGCDTSTVDVEKVDFHYSQMPFHLTKWYNNHTAAISITNDDGAPDSDAERRVQEEILRRNLVMDYEIVTYNMRDQVRTHIIEYLIPNGFGVFGHGHKHIDHDKLTYEEAYESFKTNYDIMVDMGIKPISYAYPEGAGHKKSTQQALADAGFLNGRLHRTWDHTSANIVSSNRKIPNNSFYLPSLVMQDFDFRQNNAAINNCAELIPFLDDAIKNTAWLIKTYHAIGREDGWGFFCWNEFVKALDEIESRDFWSVSMDNATRYIMQRETAKIEIKEAANSVRYDFVIRIQHDLDMEIFSHPMTVAIRFPKNVHGKIFGVYKENGMLKKEITIVSEYNYFNLNPFETYTFVELEL